MSTRFHGILSKALAGSVAVVTLAGTIFATTASPASAAPGGLSGLDPNQIVGSDNAVVSTAHITPPPAGYVPGVKGTEPVAGGGDVTPNAIIGTDDRFRVTQFIHPATTMVKLRRPGVGDDCSGFMIGADTVATAGHCVFSSTTRQWVTSIIAIPSIDGTRQPYGSCRARALYSVNGWVNSLDPQYDYGVVKLDCPDMGLRTGTLGFGWIATSLVNVGATVQGYPLDKPADTQWSAFGHILQDNNFQLFHSVDTAGGNSGSPLYGQLGSCYPCALGIQAYGLYDGSTLNRATRINQEVFLNLLAFIAL